MSSTSFSVLVAVCAGLSLASGTARAQAAPPKVVSEIVVPGGPEPQVVSSFPADNAKVSAGVLAIKIVFDQPMTARDWSYGKSDQGDFPNCLAKPRLLGDQHTFVLLCTAAPARTYAFEVNAAPKFQSATGRPAKAAVLRFSTTEVGVYTMHDALEKAGLTDADEPIMTWRDNGAGVSGSP